MAAAPSSVRWVPISGIVIRAGTNVPSRLPAVERAKTRPATTPAASTSVTARRMANGVTMPSSTTGGAKSSKRGDKGAHDGAGRQALEAADRQVEERPRDERQSRDQEPPRPAR